MPDVGRLRFCGRSHFPNDFERGRRCCVVRWTCVTPRWTWWMRGLLVLFFFLSEINANVIGWRATTCWTGAPRRVSLVSRVASTVCFNLASLISGTCIRVYPVSLPLELRENIQDFSRPCEFSLILPHLLRGKGYTGRNRNFFSSENKAEKNITETRIWFQKQSINI